MQKSKPVLKNEIHNILWDFEIPTDHLILARKSHLELNKKLFLNILRKYITFS